MYKAVVFDLDGTLLDTTSGVIYAVELTIQQLGLPRPADDVLKTFVGPPMQLSFEKHFGMEKERALECANLFRANYRDHSLLIAELYPGVMEVLAYLKNKGYKIALATNKSHDNAMAILKHFGVADYCDFMMGSDLAGKLKKADIIEKSLEAIDVDAKDAVYVGDSIFDYEGAQKVGMDFIGVTYGFGFREGEHYDFPTYHALEAITTILA